MVTKELFGEFRNKEISIISLILLLTVVIGYIFYDEKSEWDKFIEAKKEESFEGLVYKKYIDNYHRPGRIIEVNEQVIDVYWDKFYYLINVNDSVVKKLGSTHIDVYENNKIKFRLNHQEMIDSILVSQ